MNESSFYALDDGLEERCEPMLLRTNLDATDADCTLLFGPDTPKNFCALVTI